jgi:hypothetical protein
MLRMRTWSSTLQFECPTLLILEQRQHQAGEIFSLSLGLQFALIRAKGRAHRTADHKINLTMTASCQIIDALLDGKKVLA